MPGSACDPWQSKLQGRLRTSTGMVPDMVRTGMGNRTNAWGDAVVGERLANNTFTSPPPDSQAQGR
eukprot:364653-Chlamydomonas_euryale.AAC.5